MVAGGRQYPGGEDGPAAVSSTDDAVTMMRAIAENLSQLVEVTSPAAAAAPVNAQYLVGMLDGTLTAERLVTTTATISWDLATTGVAKADVVAGSIGTTQLANDGVTYAKMQDVSATSRALGRRTAGSGDVEELTLTQLLDFVGSAAQGDILYRDSAAWARLPAGTSGLFLKTQGAAANPIWDTIPTVAWVSYTPTIGSLSGTFTSVGATGRYQQVGKTVHYEMTISIATNGTAAGGITATLPFTASARSFAGAGRENALTGFMMQSFISPSGGTALILKYDNSYLGGNGASIIVTGTYESV